MNWNGFPVNNYEDSDPTAFRAAASRQRERAEALRLRMQADTGRAVAAGDVEWQGRAQRHHDALGAYVGQMAVLETWPGGGPVPVIPPLPEY